MSKSTAETEILTKIGDLSPEGRKNVFDRLPEERDRIYFQHRSDYLARVEKIDRIDELTSLLKGTELLGVDLYTDMGWLKNHCISHPDDCPLKVNLPTEQDLLAGVSQFIEIRDEYIQGLVAEGLVDLERRYFSPAASAMHFSTGDRFGQPGGLDVPVPDRDGVGGSRTGIVGIPGGPGTDSAVVTLTLDQLGDLSTDMLDDLVGRATGVTIDVGGKTGPTDPGTANLLSFLEWFEKHHADPGFDVNGRFTVRRTSDGDN